MSKKVMVVDDSKVIHNQMKKILEGSEYEVVEICRDGKSAIEAYERLQPDIVTMDIIMPGIDGMETAKVIMERWPDARILMVTSLAYDETIDEAVKIGAKGFIFKPFKADAVLGALKRAMQD